MREPDIGSITRLEEITLNSSAAHKQMLYDGWVLRFTPGSEVKRSNSITALYPSRIDLETKIAFCEREYAAHDLPIRFRLCEVSQPGNLDAALTARGYEPVERTLVMTRLVGATPSPSPVAGFAVPQLAEWIQVSSALRGTPRETLEARARRLESAAARWFPAVLMQNGQPICSGIGASEGEYFGLFDVFTPEHLRGRGHAGKLTAGLLGLAQREGASLAYLQVDEANAPARRIYERMGFEAVYAYWYRIQ
jgi:GNAT superfamily N-acetyltransferase